MLPLNASHAYLLAAMAEQIPRTASSAHWVCICLSAFTISL